jgi:pimeloyl-ACP methyl ester carboxylesterase
MRLTTREWGTGDRIALLVHGIMSDSRTWWRFGPLLADRGYRAIAADLRGHGGSGRGAYSPDLLAADLVETFPAGAALAVGHSLGGLVLSLAAGRLGVERAVYVDPAWRFGRSPRAFDPAPFVDFADRATLASIAAASPRWAAADVEVELATLADWDRASAPALARHGRQSGPPDRPIVPSLVLLADPSSLVGPDQARTLLDLGFTVRTVAGAGHSIHRDDFDGFTDALEGWI